jgi:iron complex transport system substrate-binding protein
MGYRLALIGAIFLVFAGSMTVQQRLDAPTQPAISPRWQCGRIVSMAPGITETLYALGLGGRVVGVDRDSHYPPEVERVKRTGNVGGNYNPNIEVILRLKPDLVIMLEEQALALPKFDLLKLETLVVSHQTLDGLIESFRTIGRACGKGPEGRQLALDFQNRIDCIRQRTQGLASPRVLFVLDRTFGAGRLADLHVAGDDKYIDAIIELAGGQNAYRRRGVRCPIISTEGILRLNPDAIVELVPSSAIDKHGRQAILDDWKELSEVQAVKDNRIFIFDNDYAMIPGPRLLRFIEDLAEQLHPDVVVGAASRRFSFATRTQWAQNEAAGRRSYGAVNSFHPD